jgi:hypothetical protein
MIEHLGLADGHQVLEIGTGTGYSSALMCHRLGEDNVTTVEVDPEVAERADLALESAGFSTWTVTGDGLLGHPRRAPYDRVIATCAVRRIPYTWIRHPPGPDPDTPRVIERWNGHAWECHMVASNLAEAKAILYPESKILPGPASASKALGPGTGRHRKSEKPRPESR